MTQVHDILDAINEARTALDERPQLLSENTQLTQKLNSSQAHAQQLELNISNYKQQIETLNAKVRSLEVERDDAGFRELEAQDKLDALRNVVLGVHTTLEKTLPKAEPIVEAPVVVTPPPSTSTMYGTNNEPYNEPMPTSGSQSDPSPTVSTATVQDGEVSQVTVNTTGSQTYGPYFCKAYDELPIMVNKQEWMNGGGTDYGYWTASTSDGFDRSRC